MIRSAFYAFAVSILIVSPCLAAEWYEGGTLHEATVAEWRTGTGTNKLATIADWIAATSDEKQLINAGIVPWKNASASIMACIDEATKDVPGVEDRVTSEFGLLCMQQFQEIYPFLLTR